MAWAAKLDWRWRLLIAFIAFKALVYLPLEFIFNASLVNTVAAGPNMDRLHFLELLGRTLSGVAATFIVWRWIIRSASVRFVKPALAASFVLVFGVVFFGQKALVNWISDRAGAEERYIATLMRFMPVALNAGMVEGFEFAANSDTPDAKAFRAIAGAALFLSPRTYHDIERQADRFVYNHALAGLAGHKSDREWDAYRRYRDQFIQAYGAADAKNGRPSYATASQSLQQATGSPAELAEEAWRELNKQIASEIQRAQDAKSEGSHAMAIPDLYNGLVSYFNSRTGVLARRAQTKYNEAMLRSFGRPIEPTTWCEDVDHCPGSYEFVESKARSLAGQGGLDAAEDVSLDSPRVSAFAREKLRAKGIPMPENWKATDHEGFLRAAIPALQDRAKTQFTSAVMSQLGSDAVPPGLAFEDYQRNPAVQSRMRRDFARAFPGIPLGKIMLSVLWTRQQFDNWLLGGTSEELKSRLIGPVDRYGNSGRLEVVGRESIRAILVPVVSICLSLAFTLVNIVGVVTLAIGQIRPAWDRIATRTFWVSSLLLIPIVPFLMPLGVAQSQGYIALAEHIDEGSLETRSFAVPIKWVLRTEPLMLSVGDAVTRRTGELNLTLGRDGYCRLVRLDQVVIGALPGADATECDSKHRGS